MRKIFLPLLLITNITFGQVNLNLGLRAYYPFSGNANDISGNNNNPVFNNATLTADRFGNPNSAYHFNGIDNYMRISNSASLNMNNQLSISLWVKPTGWYTGQCYNNMMVMKGDGDQLPGIYSSRFSDVYNGCSATPSTTEERFFDGFGSIATLPIVQLNQWYSVIITFDGTTSKLYVNCVLQASTTISRTFTNPYDLYFGHLNSAQFPYWLNGDLDEVRLYNRALNQDEVNVLGGCVTPLTCNNWLSTPNQNDYATIGDLDITGDQLTVEAVFNRTAPLNSGLYYGHLISKHSDASNVNYALLPNGCEITTTNGYKATFQSCPPELNKTYHVAMVYDGVNLKYYRNGFLLSQVACTGNLITNNLQTTIAQVAGAGFPPDNQFKGYANEVRIWNVARTQAQIQTYMDNALPNPTTQTGLQGYYTFDNLLNKQGNAAYNATLNAAATINATNPNCTFVPDSCAAILCNNWLSTPSDPSYITAGDIDVTGNQLTVEAVFNRTAPPPVPGSYGFLVSKHLNEFDNNYSLWPNGCALTTATNPQAILAANCDIELNKTYHVAMVYDGASLKFYRNGFLHSQTPMSGNLINNNLLTQFARNPTGGGPLYQFLGNMNEVRIWNVARTQSQLQTYMDASLPNPTTQTGLLAYYTFDNLLNKQGNAAFNATLNGAAAINTTNPNCTFVADSCAVTTSCNTWLSTPTHPSTVSIGNLNVTGNQITVEANFNCTAYNFPDVGGKLVAKHTNAANTCYALSPHAAELSTSNNGYVVTFQTCPFQLNKTYHTAMVYDGASLKFYRNGFLMSQIPCSGNISSNSLLASIGNGPTNPLITQFFGYINEMRIWNVARTQAQLQTYMNSPLPNPTTQTGLLAYYTFDNLLNKQGNAAWNGSLGGAASINATNPNCTFIADSCGVVSTSVVINNYTPVQGFNPCDNKLTVEDGTAYNVGDTVLLIQMKGAIIDSTNTAAFGTITDYKNSGNYEFNYVKSKTGNVIELENTLTRQYDIPVGKVQLIRVPYFINLSTTDTLTCLPWDGSKGGVLAFNVQNTLTLNADMDVSGKGFEGGAGYNPGNASLTCNQNDYNYPINTLFAAQKGESITTISNNILCGKGNPAAGGGGGLGHNSGGGGGGGAGVGGFGGYQLEPCGSAPFNNRGIGGRELAYSTATNKIYLGSGGGAGHADNPGNIPPGGGNGAGIIIVSADRLQSNAKKITANGGNSVVCSMPSSPDCHDATGGGGGGGTILLDINQFIDNASIENKGGKAADVIGGPISIAGRIGPGGGGAGGLAFLKAASVPANLTIVNTGGLNGVLTQDANNPWGATPGTAGQNLFNLVLPVDLVPFKTNIDSVRIKDSLLNCNGFDFKGLAYINTNPIANWQWYFGDGGQANTQNTSHAYTAAGTYIVKLIVTDINGCMDSTSINVDALPGVNAEAGPDTTICSNSTVSVTLNGTAVGGPYLWSPAAYLNNPNIQNPVATINSTTTFYLNVTGSASCTSIDSVTIYINPLPLVDTRADTAICRFSSLVLNTNSNAATYQWSPAAYVNNPNIASPNYIDNFSQRVYVTGTSALGCTATDSLDVAVNPLPVVQTIADTTLCQNENVTLTTVGAQTYSWNPAIGLNNPNIANPVFSGNSGQTYTVTGTDANGCKNTDLVTISIITPGSLKAPPSFIICQKQSAMLNGNNGNQVSYLWSPATYLSNATIINPIANPPQTTLYTLLVTDNRCGFDSTFTTLLTVVTAPVINPGKSNDIDCAFKSATLFASGGNQYLWSPSTGLSNTSLANPVATPANTQTYAVMVTDATGCSNTDSVTVFIKKAASLARYMPNAFTPDGNGTNDCYGLKNWMYIQRLQFYIFNRYGERVFATTNPNTCWDGTYKGKSALAGTYVYYIKAQTDCGLEEQKGTFILIR